jgi:hypothetical protein
MDPSPIRRTEFQLILEGVLGSSNVYFQPPDDSRMEYPCLVYELDSTKILNADNGAYHLIPRYQVTHIHKDPDSSVFGKLAVLPLSSFSRHFATSGLNHDVFVIYH